MKYYYPTHSTSSVSDNESSFKKDEDFFCNRPDLLRCCDDSRSLSSLSDDDDDDSMSSMTFCASFVPCRCLFLGFCVETDFFFLCLTGDAFRLVVAVFDFFLLARLVDNHPSVFFGSNISGRVAIGNRTDTLGGLGLFNIFSTLGLF